VPGQHRSGEVVETPRTRLAPVALPERLGIVMAVPDDDAAAAHGAARTIWPAVLAHQREALGVVDQARKVDQVGCRHDKSSSCEPVSYSRLCSRTRCSQPNFPVLASPPRNPIRASVHSFVGDRTLPGRLLVAGHVPGPVTSRMPRAGGSGTPCGTVQALPGWPASAWLTI